MTRYQIRTSDNSLEDVLGEMATAGWEAMASHLIADPHEKDRQNFRKSIVNTILPYLRAFRLCGKSNICLDEVRIAPLAENDKKVDVNPWDLVYHLFFRGNAQEFVEVLAFEAVESVKHLLSKDSQPAFEAVCSSLSSTLGKYLYFNPVCGHTELCVFSGSAPIAALGRH